MRLAAGSQLQKLSAQSEFPEISSSNGFHKANLSAPSLNVNPTSLLKSC
jgi:hypothetical protein